MIDKSHCPILFRPAILHNHKSQWFFFFTSHTVTHKSHCNFFYIILFTSPSLKGMAPLVFCSRSHIAHPAPLRRTPSCLLFSPIFPVPVPNPKTHCPHPSLFVFFFNFSPFPKTHRTSPNAFFFFLISPYSSHSLTFHLHPLFLLFLLQASFNIFFPPYVVCKFILKN